MEAVCKLLLYNNREKRTDTIEDYSRLCLVEPLESAMYPCHRLKQNSTFKHENGETLNLETSADVFIRRLS
jgi:hypothetical protein